MDEMTPEGINKALSRCLQEKGLTYKDIEGKAVMMSYDADTKQFSLDALEELSEDEMTEAGLTRSIGLKSYVAGIPIPSPASYIAGKDYDYTHSGRSFIIDNKKEEPSIEKMLFNRVKELTSDWKLENKTDETKSITDSETPKEETIEELVRLSFGCSSNRSNGKIYTRWRHYGTPKAPLETIEAKSKNGLVAALLNNMLQLPCSPIEKGCEKMSLKEYL